MEKEVKIVNFEDSEYAKKLDSLPIELQHMPILQIWAIQQSQNLTNR